MKILQQAAAIISVPVKHLHSILAVTDDGSTHHFPATHPSEPAAPPLSECEYAPLQDLPQWPPGNEIEDGLLLGLGQQFDQPQDDPLPNGSPRGVKSLLPLPGLSNKDSNGNPPRPSFERDLNKDWQFVPDISGEYDLAPQHDALPLLATSPVSYPTSSRKAGSTFERLNGSDGGKYATTFRENPSSRLSQNPSLPLNDLITGPSYLAQPTKDIAFHTHNENQTALPGGEASVGNAFHSTETQAAPEPFCAITTKNVQRTSESSSSGLVMTPSTNSDPYLGSNPSGCSNTPAGQSDLSHPPSASSVIPEVAGNLFRAVATHGPCSYVWKIPPLVSSS